MIRQSLLFFFCAFVFAACGGNGDKGTGLGTGGDTTGGDTTGGDTTGDTTGGDTTGGDTTGGDTTGGDTTGGDTTGGDTTGSTTGGDTGATTGECTNNVTNAELPLYDGELFDAHGHVTPKWPDTIVPKVVSEGGLSGFVVLGLDNTLALQKGDDKTYANCAWFEVKNGIADPEGTLDSIKAGLDDGARCIGETSVRHFASGPKGEAKEYSATESFLLSLYDEARERGVPINMHYDYSSEHVDDFEAGLKAGRDESRDDTENDTLFIWAHSGDAPGQIVGEIMAKNRNLYIDLSSRNPICSFGNRLVSIDEQRLDDGTLVLKDDWKTVMETYSDRVMVGSDVGPGKRHLDIKKIVDYYRTLLGQLSPEIADKIAHQNARKLFAMPWAGQ
jgi:hypothetical protein